MSDSFLVIVKWLAFRAPEAIFRPSSNPLNKIIVFHAAKRTDGQLHAAEFWKWHLNEWFILKLQ